MNSAILNLMTVTNNTHLITGHKFINHIDSMIIHFLLALFFIALVFIFYCSYVIKTLKIRRIKAFFRYRSSILCALVITSMGLACFSSIYSTETKTLDYDFKEGFTRLDLKKYPKLEVLKCSYTSLVDLDISHNTELLVLDCGFNYIATLDISNNTKLQYLRVPRDVILLVNKEQYGGRFCSAEACKIVS